MTVISLTDCPPRVRGDLSKWLMEINTGVYVGNLSARVRDQLWERICENLPTGRATMVFSAAGEQRMDFRVHNTTWEPVDFDGLKLMRRPSAKRLTGKTQAPSRSGPSNAAKFEKLRGIEASRRKKEAALDYTVIDLETSGVQPGKAEIIEFGALRVRGGKPVEEYSSLVRAAAPLPPETATLTGLSDWQLNREGAELEQALEGFLTFVGEDRLVGHNVSFDFSFLRLACRSCGRPIPANACIDTLPLARRRLAGVSSYKLETLAQHFSIDTTGAHRALADCHITQQLFVKLNEIGRAESEKP